MDKDLFEKAMRMAPNERLAFAELILASLEHEDNEIKSTWLSEINQRMKAVKEGKSSLLDFDAIIDEG